MDQPEEKYLLPTAIIDSDHPHIIQYAKDTIKDAGNNPVAKAVRLYYAVRDGIWYDPYSPFYLPEHYRASRVLENGRGYCVSKASLLCALGRACDIPTRVGFANVKNHLATRQIIESMGTDLFACHGFTEFYLEGRWVRATPAFNADLCRRHKVLPLEFDGRQDSLFQPYNLEKRRFMEYVQYTGTYSDIPVDSIVATWKKIYTEERVNKWIEALEKSNGRPVRYLETEDVLQS